MIYCSVVHLLFWDILIGTGKLLLAIYTDWLIGRLLIWLLQFCHF